MRLINVRFIGALFSALTLVACGGQSHNVGVRSGVGGGSDKSKKSQSITSGLVAVTYHSDNNGVVKTIHWKDNIFAFAMVYSTPICANVGLPMAHKYFKKIQVEGSKQKLFQYLAAFDRELRRAKLNLTQEPNDSVMKLEYDNGVTKTIDFSAIERTNINSPYFWKADDQLDSYFYGETQSAEQAALNEQAQTNKKCEDIDFQRHPQKYPNRLVVAAYTKCIVSTSLQTKYKSGRSTLKLFADNSFSLSNSAFDHSYDCKGTPYGTGYVTNQYTKVFRDSSFQISTGNKRNPKVSDREIIFATQHTWGYGTYYQFDIIPAMKTAYLRLWERGSVGYRVHKPYTNLTDIMIGKSKYIMNEPLIYKLQK